MKVIGLLSLSLSTLSFGAHVDDAATEALKFIYNHTPAPEVSPQRSKTLPILVRDWPGGVWVNNGLTARVGFVRIEKPDDIGRVASINQQYYAGLERSGLGRTPAEADLVTDNHQFYYYIPSGQTPQSAHQAQKFWEWFGTNRQTVYDCLAKGTAFDEVVRQANAFARTPEVRANMTQAEWRAAQPPKADAPVLQVYFPRPLPTTLPDLAGRPAKVATYEKFSAADLAQGKFVSSGDAQLRQLADYSRWQAQHAGSTAPLPKYDPNSTAAQPGDIFVRSGPLGTIPHGANYWGPNKMGDVHFDAIELRKMEKGGCYVVPMHWTADPGPQLNFYRPLESGIRCRYEGKETTLRNLPIEVKESIRDAASRADRQRLGSPHGQYALVGVVKPSNQCIDSLLEPWDTAFKKQNVVILDEKGHPTTFRNRLSFFQTAIPMSWPNNGKTGPLGFELSKVDPPYAAGRIQNGTGGVSMRMDLNEGSFKLAPTADWDRKAEEFREKARSQRDLER